ncbi:protein kinase [Streptomyces sp. NPDC051172]|uniref:protein kinase domain-containing protein n=1 Tax=Streptomyces sp. NPDC051172 TaxID=3155796 RepID=UPI00341DB7B1
MNFGGPDDLAFSRPAPVAVLGDRYELRLLLGSEGMAEVHLAHDLRLDRGVAVKTPRTDLAHDPALQERFRREAQSTASLNRPAIAAVYDTGEHLSYGAQLPYLVMEYVDGMTLREALYSGPPLTVERALEVTAGVLEALAHSHQHGIVHRDIKPANVMVTWSGQVKVMDFGIARDARDVGMTQTSLVIGTAQYLSPEQAMGHATDARSDLSSYRRQPTEYTSRRNRDRRASTTPRSDRRSTRSSCGHCRRTPRTATSPRRRCSPTWMPSGRGPSWTGRSTAVTRRSRTAMSRRRAVAAEAEPR